MEKGILTNIIGDVTTPQKISEDEIVYLPHVCNDIGGWGAGVVLAISRKWRGPEEVYKSFIRRNGQGEQNLGNVEFWDSRVNGWPEDTIVCNMVAQHDYQSDENPRPINYIALAKCMGKVEEVLTIRKRVLGNARPIRIHCPKFGSDLAGGNWDFILNLIEDAWLNVGIDVVVYEYVG